jgi:hypothetical protein
MGYVVVVCTLINTAALVAVGWYLRICWRELPMYVSSAISDEVRKQDDRIEKRLAKSSEPTGNEVISPRTEIEGIRAGVPMRR